MLTENVRLKVFSLILAILLELYFYSPDNSVRASFSASVDVRNLPANYTIVSPPGGDKGLFTRVSVLGPGPLVDQVKNSNYRFTIELPSETPSSYIATLSSSQLRLPNGVQVVEIDPSRIELKIEPIIPKQLLVLVDKVGDPAAGYRLEELKVTPQTVRATGPSSELSGFSVIETQKVDITNLKSSQRFEVALVEKGKLTTLDIHRVTVEAKIAPITEERNFERVHIKVLAPDGYAASAQPSSASVALSGPVRLLDNLAREGFDAIADAREMKEGRFEVELRAELPSGVSMIESNPKKATINLVKKHGETVRD